MSNEYKPFSELEYLGIFDSKMRPLSKEDLEKMREDIPNWFVLRPIVEVVLVELYQKMLSAGKAAE